MDNERRARTEAGRGRPCVIGGPGIHMKDFAPAPVSRGKVWVRHVRAVTMQTDRVKLQEVFQARITETGRQTR